MVAERTKKFLNTTKQSIDDSMRSFRAHRLRTALTSLGVIFGVAAVIAMLAIAEGAKRDAVQAIEKLGLLNIFVTNGGKEEDQEAAKKKNPDGLLLDDGEALRQIVPGVSTVIPNIRKMQKVRNTHASETASIVGTEIDFLYATNREIRIGRLLHPLDEEEGARVALLASEIAKKLYPTEMPVGKWIRIGQTPFKIVGVLEQTGQTWKLPNLPDWEPDKEVFIPLKTASRLFSDGGKREQVQSLLVQMRDAASVSPGGKIIRQIIERRHRGAKDYQIIVPEELLAQSQRTQRTFTIIMGAIAGISLIVGGIGIMNIMLSSVLERTQEIGIRRAIGATQAEIARQFLAEAILLSGAGGFVGLILGVILAYIVTWLAGWATVITVWSILLSLGVSITVALS
ncbi:MAG: ABC transporter permease, partial [bacterium]|nr:ABC transporter permease [bacterium]